MVSRFLNAITEALHAEFGNDYEIYTEDIEQGLTPPCFLVDLVTATREKQGASWYMYSMVFSIQYFPSGDNERKEIHNVLSRLDDCLEVITVTWKDGQTDPKVNPEVKRTRTKVDEPAITEGVLTYPIRISDVYYRVEDGDVMESADITVMEDRCI